jgi:transcriptional regulator with XRE-family HTH domain
MGAMTDFGEKIRLQRRLKSLTLKELSTETGLSISFLSEVERGISQPSIASLRKIAQSLGVSLLELSENGNPEGTNSPSQGILVPPIRNAGPYIADARVVRSGKRKRISFPGMKGYFELLTPDLNRLIEALSFKVEPGFESGQEHFRDPPGEKFMLILEGTFEFHVGDEVFILNEMDSLSYPADAPIFYKVIGEKTVRGILVITPPGF